jgi:ParB family chromosome partitioning protein
VTSKEAPLHKIHDIRLDNIRVSLQNVRHADPKRELDELAASIKVHGLMQPVVLNGEYGDPPYELISGQRRFLAHQLILKRSTIPAVFAGNLSKEESLIRSLVENLQRLELDYQDTARAVTHLFKRLGRNIPAVQKVTGLSVRKIRDYILIHERASPKMKSLLKRHKVSPADVKRAIRAAQDNLKKAEDLLELIMKYKPTAHQKRRLVTYGERSKGTSAKQLFEQATQPHVEQNIIITLADDLRDALLKATKSMSLEPEDLAAKVLTDWLRAQGFAE